jgi:hypothetical protein
MRYFVGLVFVLALELMGCSDTTGTGGSAGDGGSGGNGGSAGSGGLGFAQRAYVKASNTGSDFFGYAVAMSETTLAVSAQIEASGATGIDGDQDDDSVPSAGAVYVFSRGEESVWSQQAYVKASNTGGDLFGSSIALSGDTLAVGAPDEDGSTVEQNDDLAFNSGAVYVFARDAGGAWSQQAYVKASNIDDLDLFGTSVALSGDTLAVGATGEASGATGVGGDQSDESEGRSGAVYVFTRNAGGNWFPQAYIKASNTETLDEFGTSVALSGDTLAVGARFEDSASAGVNGDQLNNDADSSGAVYVFTRDGGTWSQQAYIKASNPDAEDQFGTSLALSGDTLVVGAPFESSSASGINGTEDDNSAINAGAAYVFERDAGGNWSQTAYLKASNADPADEFGYSVALEGDDLVVGAFLEDINATGVNPDPSDNTGTASGAAYLFTRNGDGWSQEAYLKASNTDPGDNFGFSVATAEGMVAVGATREESGATGINGDQADNSVNGAGAAYVFHDLPPAQ